jgi:hypothetical protein
VGSRDGLEVLEYDYCESRRIYVDKIQIFLLLNLAISLGDSFPLCSMYTSKE